MTGMAQQKQTAREHFCKGGLSMYAKTLAVVVTICLTMTTTATPVMALQHLSFAGDTPRSVVVDGLAAARQVRTGDIAALERLLDRAAPQLSPDAQLLLDDIRTAYSTHDTEGGIEAYLRYAGSVLLLLGILMIVGGIQLVVTGTDISEGLVSIILGIIFALFGLSILAEAGRPDPA
jgi:hypothetical protein